MVTRAVVINWPGQAQQLLQEIKRLLICIRENILPYAGMTFKRQMPDKKLLTREATIRTVRNLDTHVVVYHRHTATT